MTSRCVLPLALMLFCAGGGGAKAASADANNGSGPAPGPPRALFKVLRATAPVPLPAAAGRTLARLRVKPPGSRVVVRLSQARRIGPKRAALYLVPGSNGICVMQGRHGKCSTDLDALWDHGLHFAVARSADAKTGVPPVDLYGVLPDGLSTVSAQLRATSACRAGSTLCGTNAHDNGYFLPVPAPFLYMYLTGPRGPVTLGRDGRPR